MKTQVWRYQRSTGLYFPADSPGYGLTFDELAQHYGYVAGHDDKPEFQLEFGPPLDDDDY